MLDLQGIARFGRNCKDQKGPDFFFQFTSSHSKSPNNLKFPKDSKCPILFFITFSNIHSLSRTFKKFSSILNSSTRKSSSSKYGTIDLLLLRFLPEAALLIKANFFLAKMATRPQPTIKKRPLKRALIKVALMNFSAVTILYASFLSVVSK